jgi:hypothetical protein
LGKSNGGKKLSNSTILILYLRQIAWGATFQTVENKRKKRNKKICLKKREIKQIYWKKAIFIA